MRVCLDYCQGPVLGHKVRCELLMEELQERGGHSWRVAQYSDPRDDDVYIYDHPVAQKPGDRSGFWDTPIRISMGQQITGAWCWNPLGQPDRRTLAGLEYIMLDPRLAPTQGEGILITMGGSDPTMRTEVMMDALQDMPCTVVQGPNFGRDIVPCFGAQRVVKDVGRAEMVALLQQHNLVVCGWGQTVFEAMYTGARVFPVSDDRVHHAEALQFQQRIGGWVDVHRTMEAWSKLRRQKGGAFYITDNVLDLQGAARTVDWIEMLHRVYGGGQWHKKCSRLTFQKDTTHG